MINPPHAHFRIRILPDQERMMLPWNQHYIQVLSPNGGGGHRFARLEIMNIETGQWHEVPIVNEFGGHIW